MTLDSKFFFDALADRGISFYAGVPDSLLKAFCAYVTDHADARNHIITANEGGAIALAAGHHLASGDIGVAYMQNSGLGNAVNPLTSLADADVYGVPLLLIIGWRGEPGRKDQPQHVKMGGVTRGTLDALGVPHAVLPDTPEPAIAALDSAITTMRERSGPYALVVRKGTFENYKLKTQQKNDYELGREQALDIILAGIEPNAAIVSTTGMPSREVFELRNKRDEHHDADFLTVGSMGHTSQIALGVALKRPNRHVYCIDGDGAVIMHMGGLTTIGSLAPENYRHIVLNNAAHDSVGGQPTVGYDIDFCAIARGCGYRRAVCAETEEQLRAAMSELRNVAGSTMLEVRVRRGARTDLGRPTNTPKYTKSRFMAFLSDEDR